MGPAGAEPRNPPLPGPCRVPDGRTRAKRWLEDSACVGEEVCNVGGRGLSRSRSFGSFGCVKCLLGCCCLLVPNMGRGV